MVDLSTTPPPTFEAGCICGWHGASADVESHHEVCPLPDPSEFTGSDPFRLSPVEDWQARASDFRGDYALTDPDPVAAQRTTPAWDTGLLHPEDSPVASVQQYRQHRVWSSRLVKVPLTHYALTASGTPTEAPAWWWPRPRCPGAAASRVLAFASRSHCGSPVPGLF